ncbi:unnamed protein product [Mesocestoides corti]|uniref:Reverse transcriptase domain-containing protein n=1 Tax=Mesocestoides corti TaxID=53468 RepID=A0A0R3UPU2_MESCO|nr:unnamed protein product [Mesocestoides corti]
MHHLAGSNKVDDSVLRQLWAKCLRMSTNGIISIQTSDTLLEKLAEIADKVHECYSEGPGHETVSSGTTANTYNLGINKLDERLDKLSLKFNELARTNLENELAYVGTIGGTVTRHKPVNTHVVIQGLQADQFTFGKQEGPPIMATTGLNTQSSRQFYVPINTAV